MPKLTGTMKTQMKIGRLLMRRDTGEADVHLTKRDLRSSRALWNRTLADVPRQRRMSQNKAWVRFLEQWERYLTARSARTAIVIQRGA